MNIFRLFESIEFMKICSKTHEIALLKKFLSGKHAPNSPSKSLATPRSQAPKKVGHLWQIRHTPMHYY